MQIKVQLTGLIRMALGTSQLSLELAEGATVGEVIDELVRRTESGSASGPPESIDAYLVLLKRQGRSRSIQLLDGPGTLLHHGDELILAHRFTGG